MTPPDNPGPTGPDTGQEPDRTAVVGSGGDAHPDRSQDGTDDLELSHGTPPPWQRMPAANQANQVNQAGHTSNGDSIGQHPGQRTMPVSSGDEATVSVERPVHLAGAGPAAGQFGGGPPPGGAGPAEQAGQGGSGRQPAGPTAPPRTTVHLEGAGPAAGGQGRGAGTPPSALRRPGRGPRRANLQIKRFDPWSVLKLSLVLGVALFFVWLVAVGVLYAVLDGMGVWDKVNGISSELLQPADQAGEPLISAGRVFGVAAIVGAINIVLLSALSTVGAFIYNVSADLAGGLEITLAERE